MHAERKPGRRALGLWMLPMFAIAQAQAQVAEHPILFVAQVPTADDFGNAFSTFGSHLARPTEAPRGGDLMIRYPDGALRNLTREAGFGSNDAFQGAEAIAVRDPAVHWSGTRAIFSMVVGAPSQQYQVATYYWQLYEVSGLAQGQSATVTRLARQPADFNNVNPVYGSDDSIIFASDRPRSGERHLYPQQDEYESAATVTGLWKIDAGNGELRLLQHSPSGSFDPIVDSYGRVLFTRWDHLQTDQQAEADAEVEAGGGTPTYGTFDFTSEAANATRVPRAPEVFPEPLTAIAGSGTNGHRFNFFFPWTVHQDGSEEETLNHLGRHELHDYFPRNFTADPDLDDFTRDFDEIENMMQIAEDPSIPGRYLAVDAPEFATHASGQLFMIDAPLGANPDGIAPRYLTPRSTFLTAPAPDHSGRYRNPAILANGTIIAAHTPDMGEDDEQGSATAPDPRYDFRLKFITDSATPGVYRAGASLTPGIVRTASYYTPDVLVTYTGPLWELSPVEVRARTAPPSTRWTLKSPEQQVFDAAGVDLHTFRDYLRERDLGLVVMRDVTRRDGADEQQPYNLRVPGGVAESAPGAQLVRDIDEMQFVQADQVRGLTYGGANPRPGRRPLARYLHDGTALAANPPQAGVAPGSRKIASDGSVALFVPTRRALSWQALAPNDAPVVRERFWLTLQPGEVRACDGCHGVNTASQSGAPAAINPPQALADLLAHWKQSTGILFGNAFEATDR